MQPFFPQWIISAIILKSYRNSRARRTSFLSIMGHGFEEMDCPILHRSLPVMAAEATRFTGERLPYVV